MPTKQAVKEIRQSAVANLDKALSDRYSEFDKITNVLSKVKFIDITSWPSDLTELSQFCNEDVRYLLEHFSVPLGHAGIGSSIDVMRQFRDLKMQYASRISDYSSSDFWPKVFKTDKDKFKDFLLLVELLLCLPFSTAIVERGFSAVRRIVTDWRSTLGPGLIDDCLHLSTRKVALRDISYRRRLVDRAADTFLNGVQRDFGGGEDIATLTKRRVNLILKGLEVSGPQTEVSQTDSDSEVGGVRSKQPPAVSEQHEVHELSDSNSDSLSDYDDSEIYK